MFLLNNVSHPEERDLNKSVIYFILTHVQDFNDDFLYYCIRCKTDNVVPDNKFQV